jgi:hypothetical protein
MTNFSITVDFFEVTTNGSTFPVMLQMVRDKPDDEHRTIKRYGVPIRLQGMSQNGSEWEGAMIRIRMQDVPVKASLSGETEEIDLKDDQGLGEETAFLFHAPTKTLALERNRHGVTASALEYYFGELAGGESIDLLPILRQDAMKRLAKIDVVTRFEVRVAGVDSGEIWKGQTKGVSEILDLRETFKAPTLSLTFSMARQKGGLASVRASVKDLLKMGGNKTHAERIVVSGIDEEGGRESIDLMNFRMKETIPLDTISDRRLTISSRSQAVRQAWAKRKAEIMDSKKT